MPSTARQLRQPPTIEAIGRVPYFADVGYFCPIFNKVNYIIETVKEGAFTL